MSPAAPESSNRRRHAATDPATRDPGTCHPFLLSLVVLGLFFAVAVPMIVRGFEYPRVADDQNRWHLSAVRAFARQWPHPDFRDYDSATTPGYHVLLALADRYVSDDTRVLRAFGTLWTAGLLTTLCWALGRRNRFATALALALPVLCSIYVFSSGAWALPDNAAWWGVLAVLLLALRRRVDGRTYLLGGSVLLALVFVRQIHLWAAAVLWVAAWLGPEPQGPAGEGEDPGSVTLVTATRIRRVIAMGSATLPAFALIACFFRLWKGGTPPTFKGGHQGGNLAALPTALTTFGEVALFYLGFALPRLSRPAGETPGKPRRSPWRWVAAGLLAGAVIGAVPVTTYSLAANRFGGIWNLVKWCPYVHDRSPVMIAGSALGGATLALFLAGLRRRDRWIMGTAWAGFLVAQTANAAAWQRYYEPFALITLALMASRMASPVPAQETDQADARPALRWAIAGPAALAALLAVVSGMTMRGQS